jgi:hypothetical protein
MPAVSARHWTFKPTHNVTTKCLQYQHAIGLSSQLITLQRNQLYSGILDYDTVLSGTRRSQWLRVLRRGTAAASLLGLWVRNARGAWMSVCLSVCCECCVLSGRGLCDGLITGPEESNWVLCVWVWWWILDNEEVPVPVPVPVHCGLMRYGRKRKLSGM